MAVTFNRIAIIGATGATGIHLTRELLARGEEVRVVSRSSTNLERAFGDLQVERVAADALEESSTRSAVEGCDLVIDCIGLPGDLMEQHPATARAIVNAATAVGARCVQVSSFWAFLPLQRQPLTESHPRTAGNSYIRARRDAEDIMREAGAAVIHLPDFFGPHVHTSSLQLALQEAAAGGPMNWIGSPTTEREYAFVPDAMRIVADLLSRQEAYGEAWIVPGPGPLTARRVAEIASEHLRRDVKLRAAPTWVLRVMSLFSADLRGFMPMVPHYVQPLRYDATKLRGLIGELETTAYEEAIPTTLDWIEGSQ
jgi:nucleoside-diphosphate-sugar epimerase